MKVKKKRIAISLTDEGIKALNELIKQNEHLNKSQMIEILIKKGLKSVK